MHRGCGKIKQKVEIKWFLVIVNDVSLLMSEIVLSSSSSGETSRADQPDHPLSGLALVGSRAALSFAFAFLRRAWRSGEDADLCTEVLEESLEALQSLPEATLFDGVSSVWLDVVERTLKFLRTIVQG